MSKLHVVLDMDGTLIDNEGIGLYRPYLQEFIDFCFAEFASVNIWTAASEDWYDKVHENVLNTVLGEREFGFVWCGRQRLKQRTIAGTEGLFPTTVEFKDMRDLWDHYDHLTPDNTILIDDLIHTISLNTGNSIYVPTFKNRIAGPDTYLKHTMVHLNIVLGGARAGKKLSKVVLDLSKAEHSVEQTHDSE